MGDEGQNAEALEGCRRVALSAGEGSSRPGRDSWLRSEWQDV